MPNIERPKRAEDPDELPEVRGVRDAMFTPHVVDIAYSRYLNLLKDTQFKKISSRWAFIKELGRALYVLDILIQYYGHQAHESGGEYVGPVHELSFESSEEQTLIVARASSRIVPPDHPVTVTFSPNSDRYFSIIKVPFGKERLTPNTPIDRGVSILFRNNKYHPRNRVVRRGIIGTADSRLLIGNNMAHKDAVAGGQIFDTLLKDDFSRVMPK